MVQRALSGEKQVSERNPLQEQIREIADAIYLHKGEVKESGLLSGEAGITLFFAYMAIQYADDIYEEITQEYLEKLSDTLAGQQLSYNFSTGVAGIAFVFQHLRNIGLLDVSEDIGLAALDEIIIKGSEQDFTGGNWDPLHGLVGLGIYFIERHKETGDRICLERIVDQLSALACTEKRGKVWVTRAFMHYSGDNYNFGMAHGMPGLLSFLAQVYMLKIRRTVIEELIPSCFSFLFDHYHETGGWYGFPASIEIKAEGRSLPSRNGWCYGDLGMAQALIHCGRALGREDWVQLGVGIALKTTHIPLEAACCRDATFCHGATGLIHQYNRLYRSTLNTEFKDAADKWIALSNEHYYQPENYPGGYAYRTYDDAARTYENVSSYGLLEGIAGIGLVFLSYDTAVLTTWDVIFQTNL